MTLLSNQPHPRGDWVGPSQRNALGDLERERALTARLARQQSPAEFIIFNTQFLVFDTQFLAFNKKSIILLTSAHS